MAFEAIVGAFGAVPWDDIWDGLGVAAGIIAQGASAVYDELIVLFGAIPWARSRMELAWHGASV